MTISPIELRNGFPGITPTPAGWQTALNAAVCERCDWHFLLPPESQPPRCPRCFLAPLTILPETSLQWPYREPPELVIPFTVAPETVVRRLQEFGRGIWFAPADLNSQTLTKRLRRVYLPMWLVDTGVKAVWQAEVGFNYQVVSHRERYDDRRGVWNTQEVTETRQRWEARAGRLERTYQNISAPALEAHQTIFQQLGEYASERAQPYQPDSLTGSYVRLPDRSQEDAWPAAVPGVQKAAAEECRQASGGDHIRQFRWSPEYPARNWTLLLLPALITYYLDDDKKPQTIWINGQTGKTSGKRRASLKRAQNTALVILGIAGSLFCASLLIMAAGIIVPPLLILGGIVIIFAFAVALGAVIPVGMAWQVNRQLRDQN